MCQIFSVLVRSDRSPDLQCRTRGATAAHSPEWLFPPPAGQQSRLDCRRLHRPSEARSCCSNVSTGVRYHCMLIHTTHAHQSGLQQHLPSSLISIFIKPQSAPNHRADWGLLKASTMKRWMISLTSSPCFYSRIFPAARPPLTKKSGPTLSRLCQIDAHALWE